MLHGARGYGDVGDCDGCVCNEFSVLLACLLCSFVCSVGHVGLFDAQTLCK